VAPAVLHGLPLAQADFVEGLFQLVVLALFLAGPLIARGLKALAERAGGQEASEGRAAPRRPRSDAEESGRDIWRQLMELEEVPDLEEVEEPPRRPARRPQDPLHDPDVERVEDDALRRRRRRAAAEASAPLEAPTPTPTPPRPVRRAPEPARPAPDTIVSMERLESALPSVPDEEAMERIDADARRRRPLADLGSGAVGGVTGAPGTARGSLGGAGFTSLASAAAPSSVGRAAVRRTALGRPSRAALRRAVLWSEVLGPPVSMRDAACGGRGPTQS